MTLLECSLPGSPGGAVLGYGEEGDALGLSLRPRLLITDDECTDRRVMRWLAESCGFSVREASSLSEMTTIMQEWEPEVLVLDIVMPDADGIEIMRLLGSMHCSFSLLLVTACRAVLKPAYDLGLAYGLHMVDALAKPLDPDCFKDGLRRAIMP